MLQNYYQGIHLNHIVLLEDAGDGNTAVHTTARVVKVIPGTVEFNTAAIDNLVVENTKWMYQLQLDSTNDWMERKEAAEKQALTVNN